MTADGQGAVRIHSIDPLGRGETRPGHACIPNSGEAFSPKREPIQAAPAHPEEDPTWSLTDTPMSA